MQRIVFDKTSQDLGEVKVGSTSTATFRFRNAGGKPLKITDVQRCCGVGIKLDKSELAPGEDGLVTVQYTAGAVPQLLTRKIRLATNDPQNPRMELTITGKVVQTVTWTPARFEIAPYEENITCPEITIKSLDGKPIAVKSFSATGESLTADFDPSRTATELILRPRVDRAKLESQASSTGRVIIDLSHSGHETIHLDFDVKSIFEVTPPRIFITNVEPGAAVLRTLLLQDRRTTSNGHVSAQIESVKFKNGARVDVRNLTNNGRNSEMNLALWPPGDLPLGSLWTDQLLIQMKGGRQVTIPVNVLFKTQPLSSATNPASGS